jgi:hypothetical protein
MLAPIPAFVPLGARLFPMLLGAVICALALATLKGGNGSKRKIKVLKERVDRLEQREARMTSFFCRLGGLGVAVVALLGAGCASSDLSGDSKTTDEVVECLPPGTPAPAEIARAIWFPYASGMGSAGTSLNVHVAGVLALAGNRLWFMTWNDSEHHFDMVHDIDFLRAEKVRVDRLGTSAVLVVQSGNDSYDSFELMGAGAIASDPAAAQGLCDRIQAQRAKNPQQDQ